MLPGDLLCKFMKERLEENLEFFRDLVKRDLDRQPEKVNLQVLLISKMFSLTCIVKSCSCSAVVSAVLHCTQQSDTHGTPLFLLFKNM